MKQMTDSTKTTNTSAIGRLWGCIRRSDTGYSWLGNTIQDYSIDALCQLALVETRYGESIVVHFHLKGKQPAFFNWHDLKKHESSNAIFNPSSRIFQESANDRTTMIFPVPVGQLSKECDLIQSATKCPDRLLYLRFVRYPYEMMRQQLQTCSLLRERILIESLEAVA
jgi:hypothetical protein